MKMEAKKIIILIPVLRPDKRLLVYLQELIGRGFHHIIIVNDGSDETYDHIFEEISDKSECTVLKHEKNRGKGMALKTGYQYILSHFTECQGVITVDSDGQHLAADVERIAEAMRAYPDKFILGERNLGSDNVPIKSRIGNRTTSALVYALYGKWLGDTQTGLRGIGFSHLKKMIEISGERFEYEMQVLINCIREGISIHSVPICTIYEDNNSSTHFKAVKDSMEIIRILFGNFFKFTSVSLFCAAIDYGVAFMELDLLKPYMAGQDFLRITCATVIARFFAVMANYILNKKIVFSSEDTEDRQMFMRYLMLCVFIMIASASLVYGAQCILHINEKLAKPLADIMLFGVSYKVQTEWIFGRNRKESV